MQEASFGPVSFKDANTGDQVSCRYYNEANLAHPETFGMVRWHPHPPQLPQTPVYTYHLAGIPENTVAGTLVAARPDVAKGLCAIIAALENNGGARVLPPGVSRGNPLPVDEVLRIEYDKLYKASRYLGVGYPEEVTAYHMQVYTWRVSDLLRVSRRLKLDPEEIFSTRQNSENETPGFLNFAGDSYYVDPMRLQEPSHEPRMEDAVYIDENSRRVFRQRPGADPRDRPATWHNNYSEITGKPDPMHDFGIKLWKSDAPWGGSVTHYRYACCWQAMGSPGCLIGYPSKRKSVSASGADTLSLGQPSLYQWFGGFEPSSFTVQFRGTGFSEEIETQNALHDNIVKKLTTTPGLIDKIAKRTPLNAEEKRVVLQVAEWMYLYNAPLMGSALYPRQVTDDVEAYLDRMVHGRIVVPRSRPPQGARPKEKEEAVTPPAPTKIPGPSPPQKRPIPEALVTWIAELSKSAARYNGAQKLVDELKNITFRLEQEGAAQFMSTYLDQIKKVEQELLATVPLYEALDVNDQWLIDKKRRLLNNDKRFLSLFDGLKKLKAYPEERALLETAAMRPDNDFEQILLDVQKDHKFWTFYTSQDVQLRTYVKGDMYLEKLLGYMDEILKMEYAGPEDAKTFLVYAKKPEFRKGEEAKMDNAYTAFKTAPLRPIKGLLNTLETALTREFTQQNLELIRGTVQRLVQKYSDAKVPVLVPPFFADPWTIEYDDSDAKYYIPENDRRLFADFLGAYFVYLQNPAVNKYPKPMLQKWEEDRERGISRVQLEKTDAWIKEYTNQDEMFSDHILETTSGTALSIIEPGNVDLRTFAGFKMGKDNAIAVKFVTSGKKLTNMDALINWRKDVYAAQSVYFKNNVTIFPKDDNGRRLYLYLIQKIWELIAHPVPEKEEEYVSLVKQEADKFLKRQ